MKTGDLNQLLAGLRAGVSIASIVVPAGLLAYHTWKMKCKDLYEVAWIAIAWLALAYMIR